MKRCFLDTNAWLDLLKRNPRANDALRTRLSRAASTKRIEIVLGYEVFKELTNENQRDESQFHHYIDYLNAVTHGKIVWPASYRVKMEFEAERDLEFAECFFPYIESLEELARAPEIATIPQETKAQKDRSKQDEFKATKELMAYWVKRAGSKAKLEPLLKEWRTRLISSADEWYFERSERMSAKAKGKKLRTLYTYLLFEQVKQHLLGDPDLGDKKRRKLCGTRLFDQAIYTDARTTHCDYLVTGDGNLILIAETIYRHFPDSPKPISFDDFIDHISGLVL